MKRIMHLRNIYFFLFFTLLLFSFNNCSKQNSNTDTSTPVDTSTPDDGSSDGSNTVSSTTCTDSQLQNLEQNLTLALSTVTTDADFSLKVESEDGRTFSYSTGSSTMNSVYESASTSKWISASIILNYIDSDTNRNSAQPLSLTSRPQDFISSTYWPVTAGSLKSQITLRDLLSFTSGLTSDPFCVTGTSAKTMPNCIKDIFDANVSLTYAPGTQFDYGSSHLQVAGYMTILAREIALSTSGTSWQNIFTDFKNQHSLFSSSEYNLPNTYNPRLAGGMSWTGQDYFAFIKKYYYSQIYSVVPFSGQSLTVRQLQLSDNTGTGVTIGYSPVAEGINEDWHYGFGLWLECHSTSFDCSSIESYSSPGAYGAYPFMNLNKKYFGLIAREGDLGTFRKGIELFNQFKTQLNAWAIKDCSQ